MKRNIYFRVEDIFILSFVLILFAISFMQIIKNRTLQTQIDELRIIVNQRVLPALILDTHNLTVR